MVFAHKLGCSASIKLHTNQFNGSDPDSEFPDPCRRSRYQPDRGKMHGENGDRRDPSSA